MAPEWQSDLTWEQLAALEREDRAAREREAHEPPAECPLCGSLLQVREGVRNCPMGHYRWEE